MRLWKEAGYPVSIKTLDPEPLLVGDIEIRQKDSTLVLFERKSISDLLASIKDRRYKEQSLRLSEACDIPNHNIVYIIEGVTKKEENLLVDAVLCSLGYFKGFSVLRTQSVNETCRIIHAFAKKIAKENRPGYAATTDESGAISYPGLVKKRRSDNITPDNFLEIVLCQVPGISSVTASAISAIYGKLPELVKALQTNPNCLNDIKLVDKKGGMRKISKTGIANIAEYIGTSELSL